MNFWINSNTGEGFDRGENYYSRPRKKASFASWFVKVGSTEFHLGCDHRGTSFEIGTTSNDVLKVVEDIKKIIDLYKEKVYEKE